MLIISIILDIMEGYGEKDYQKTLLDFILHNNDYI